MKYVRRRTAAKKSTRRVSRKRPAARKSIAKIVKSIISRQAENKMYIDYGINQSIVSCTGTTPTFKNVCPLVNQGDGSSGRTGNEIRVKNGYIRGHVNLLPFDATTNNLPLPCYVKMWVASCRVINTPSLSTTSIGSNFFEIGNSAVGFQGNMLDIDFSPNTDDWKIYYTKTIKLGAGYATGSTIATSSYFDNSPMSMPFNFNIGKHMGLLKYDETTTGARNKNMFLIFQVVPATGQNGAGQFLAEYHYTTRVEYEDM